MKFCSASSASASVWVTTKSMSAISPIMSTDPRVVPGLVKWPATRLRIDLALPT